jgi:hypothetical protein
MRHKTIVNVACIFLAILISSSSYAQNHQEKGERRFDNALGYCLDAGFAVESVSVSVRHTVIEYVLEGDPLKANGNNLGLFVTIVI